MTHPYLELGLPVGAPLHGWRAPPRPPRKPFTGRYCRLEPADPERHAADLHAANARDAEGRMWVYLAYGPFESESDYRQWLAASAGGDDPVFYAVVEAASGRAVGLASFLRIDPANGVIEVGHLAFSPALQRTVAATEAIYLMMRWVFESGYRRFEWKCNALNEPSRRAAQRLGFSYEGTFRQAVISKGRNRDTAWYAMIDAEWPALSAAYERWLGADNFDPAGRQRVALGELTGSVLKSRG